MVFPFRVEVHQVAKIESISKRLKTGVSGGEHCNQQIQKQNKRDTEVNYQEQDSRKTLLSHVFEGEAAHSPGEEGEERGIETTEEVVVVEEVDSNESEEEGHEQEDESNAKQVPEHVLDDGDEGTQSGTYFDLLEHLHPNRSNEEAKENSSFEWLSWINFEVLLELVEVLELRKIVGKLAKSEDCQADVESSN